MNARASPTNGASGQRLAKAGRWPAARAAAHRGKTSAPHGARRFDERRVREGRRAGMALPRPWSARIGGRLEVQVREGLRQTAARKGWRERSPVRWEVRGFSSGSCHGRQRRARCAIEVVPRAVERAREAEAGSAASTAVHLVGDPPSAERPEGFPREREGGLGQGHRRAARRAGGRRGAGRVARGCDLTRRIRSRNVLGHKPGADSGAVPGEGLTDPNP
jgi:hypothetical protein